MLDFTSRTRNQNSFSSTASRTAYDAGLREYMLKVYNYMATALGISGAVAFITAHTPALFNLIFGTPLAFVVMFAPLIFVFYMGAKIHTMSVGKAKNCLWIFSTLMGLSLSTILVSYTGTSVARVFFITATMFGSMSLYGYTTKKDLTGMGSFLFMGLIGIILASVVNLFLQSSGLHFAISVIGVFIFIGLTAYDTQKLKQIYYQTSGNAEMLSRSAVMGALNLYLDFINLFIMMMHLMGDRR